MENKIADMIDDALSNVHTMTIAKVTAVNGTTINAKPVTKRKVKDKSVALPEFVNIPTFHISGGGSSLAMPIAVGDYAIVLISETNFDNWYHGSDESDAYEGAKFDYSDSIALVGIGNKNNAIGIPSVATFIKDVLFSDNVTIEKNLSYNTIDTNGASGVTTSFTEHSGKTVTVTNGIITGVA